MVLGARLRTVMSSIIRWRKAEILPAGGTEYAEGLLLLMRGTVMENPVERHVGDSGNQVGVTTRRSWQPNATRRVSTFVDIAPRVSACETPADHLPVLLHPRISFEFQARIHWSSSAPTRRCEYARVPQGVCVQA